MGPLRARTLHALARLLALCAALAAAWAPPAAVGWPAAPDPDPIVVDGTVRALARNGATLYLGGDFGYVGVRTSAARVGPDGRDAGAFPRVLGGDVRAVVADGSGGWFLGGDFTQVGGEDVPRLAHVLPGGDVDAAFRPAPDGAVHALALAGGVLYAGGDFTAPRARLAALDPADGTAAAWAPGPDGTVRALAADGGRLLVAGDFTHVAGASRGRAAAFTLATGALTAWDPGADGPVNAIAAADGDVYLGGDFAAVGALPRARLAEVDAATAAPTAWDPGADDSVYAIAPAADAVYVAGAFRTVAHAGIARLAKVDRVGDDHIPWYAYSGTPVHALTLQGGVVYAAGLFGTPPTMADAREQVVGLDATTAAITWRARVARSPVRAIAVAAGGDVVVGGGFDSAGGGTHERLAAVDLATGRPTSWAPDPDAPVDALALHDGTLYAAGSFTHVAGQARGRGAAFDVATGALAGWDPGADDRVTDLLPSGGVVYAGGAFTTIGGGSHRGVAALDPDDAHAASWDPGLDGGVTALAAAGDAVYLGGTFSHVGGAAHGRIAAVRRDTGAALPFDPDPRNADGTVAWGVEVNAIVPDGDRVFVGGRFARVGGVVRGSMAALDAATGIPTPWTAERSPEAVHAMALRDGRLLAVGVDFSWMGVSLGLLTELDPATGSVLHWPPRIDGTVQALWSGPGGIVLGGDMTTAAGAAVSGLTTFTDAPVLRASPSVAGTPSAGATLTCETGQWDNAPTGLAVAWLRDGVALPGGASTLVVAPEDVGHALRCRVTASNMGGAATAESADAGSPAPPRATVAPRVTGTPEYGSDLACDPGTWDGAPDLAYAWLRDGTEVEGADGAVYTLGAADAGAAIACRVRAQNAGGLVTEDAAAVAVPRAAVNQERPAVTGTPAPGEELTCTEGVWTGSPTAFTYAWTRDQQPIAGATGNRYTVLPGDRNSQIGCVVTARNAGGLTQATAAPDAWVPPAPPSALAPPAVTGPATSGGTLACAPGTWSGQDWLDHAWTRDGAPVDNAFGTTLLLDNADIGHLIACVVTARNGGGTTQATSAAVLVSGPARAPVPVIAPSLDTWPQWDALVRCTGDTWRNAPTGFAYRWLRDGVPVPGATGPEYRVGDDDGGRALRCEVTARNAHGETAALSWPVQTPDPPAADPPVIAGAGDPGAELACSAVTWRNVVDDLGVTWRLDGADIPGATGPRYTVREADRGGRITCAARARGQGGVATVVSAPLDIAPPVPVAAEPPRMDPAAPSVGTAVTCAPGTWRFAERLAVSWLVDGAVVADGDRYVPGPADAGRALACRVTAANRTGQAQSDTAPAPVAAPPAAAPAPPAPVTPSPPAPAAPAPAPAPAAPGLSVPAALTVPAGARSIRAQVRCPAATACRGTLRLRTPAGRVIATATFALPAGGRAAVQVPLRAAVARGRSTRLLLVMESGRVRVSRRVTVTMRRAR